MEGGKFSLKPIGTVFAGGGCCGSPNPNRRVIKEGRLYHGRNDKVLDAVRDIIMQYFWDWLKKNHGAGIAEDDTSYIHPKNLKPWEKNAIAYINPNAGGKGAVRLFDKMERYLMANGFRMDAVKTFRAGQVQEEMKLMETDMFKKYYCRLIFSGDGLVHELINGYYERNDHDQLKLRFGAFPGGRENNAAWMSQWSYNLNEPDPINVLWAVTRMHFEPLDICKYETNGPRDIIYGFHNCSMGYITDVHVEKRKNTSSFAAQAKKTVKTVKHKKYNLSYCAKDSSSDFPAMPGINDDVPSDWKKDDCHAFNILFCHYPIYHRDHEVTKRVNLGGHYGDLIVNDVDANDLNASKKKLDEW